MFVEGQLFSKAWNIRTSRFAFLKTVILTFEELKAEERSPSSTFWTTNHCYLRRHAMPRVLHHWREHTGLDVELFPWSEDEVATTWEEWRKLNKEYREEYCRQVGLHGLADQYKDTSPATRKPREA